MASSLKLSNNGIGRLAAGISAADTSISLVPGDGAKFPALTGVEYFPLTLVRASDNAIEIVKVTARSSDTLTIERAKESTTALAFIAGDRAELRMTASTFTDEVARVEALATAEIETERLADGLLSADAPGRAKMADGFVNTAKLGAGAVTSTKILAALRSAMHGKCRLTKSGANLILSQYDGQTIVDGADNILTIPSAGVTLAPTGATPSTTYYIYAYDNDSDGIVDLLERSTTGHTTASNGVRHKTGATGGVLVGMAYCVTGPAWSDKASLVLSWFNKMDLLDIQSFTTNRNASSGAAAEINSEIRAEFLCWDSHVVECIATGSWSNASVASNKVYMTTDGIGTSIGGAAEYGNTPVNPFALSGNTIRSEGYHYATLTASISAGTCVFNGNTSVNKTILQVTTRG